MKKESGTAKDWRSHPVVREGTAIVLVVAALFFTISLLTYNNTDPAFTTPGQGKVHNYGGLVGSYTADILYHLVGAAAFLFPLYVFAFAGILFRNKKWTRKQLLIHLAGGVMLVLSLATLLSLEYETLKLFSQTIYKAGGVIGNGVASGMNLLFAKTGTYLMVLTLL
ncbi:MAG: DNA translocase FtsK 4TM domain-containing protein, partial [bacterium]|nr:DNA translocase FtsK 4TM domain-containing protein [bacterium]